MTFTATTPSYDYVWFLLKNMQDRAIHQNTHPIFALEAEWRTITKCESTKRACDVLSEGQTEIQAKISQSPLSVRYFCSGEGLKTTKAGILS